MKAVLCCWVWGGILIGSLAAAELQPIPEEFVKALAPPLVEQATRLNHPKVKLDGDVALANGVHVPDKIGLLIVPQQGLAESEELAARFRAENGAPLAWLFLYHVAPVLDGRPVDKSQLPSVTFRSDDGQEHVVHVLRLAVKQLSDEDYRLHGYGVGDKPLVDAKFSQQEAGVAKPVAIELQDPNQETRQGQAVVTVFGKYQARFPVGHAE